MTATYQEFLARKQLAAHAVGRVVDVADVHPSLHEWQARIATWAVRVGRAAVWADTGLGKAQPADELVLTPGGWRPIGQLGVGDEVMSVDGLPTRVVGVFPQGPRPTVAVTFTDGSRVRCDEGHLWTVATDLDVSRERPWRTLTTRQLVEVGLREPCGRYRWRIPVTKPVEHPTAPLPIDPYVLGVLLGDGSFRLPGGPFFTSVDEETAAEVKARLPTGMRVTPYGSDDHAPNYRLVVEGRTNWNKSNPFLAAIKRWGLHGRLAHEKFIPDDYLMADVGQRLDLLRGLMDTDGYAAKDGTIQFNTSSPRLAEGVAALVQSLGGTSRRAEKTPTYTYRSERRTGRQHYTLTLRMPNGTIPFLLPRKTERCRDRYYVPLRKIKAVEPAGTADCVCIAVAHPTQLYITRDYVVTHNTRIQLEWSRLSADTTLLVAPLAVCAQTVQEAARIGITARYVRDQAAVTRPGIWVTNYEMVERFDPAAFGAVVLDESSILKDVTSKTRDKLIAHFATVPLRLACSATPAPNDVAELANHAEFLGQASRREMLSTYFVHDQDGWRPKGHARSPMFRWMSTWAMALRRPSDIGYPDDGYILPALDIRAELIPVEVQAPDGQLFATDLGGVGGRARIRRETLTARVARAAELVLAEPDEAWLLWCGLNEEAERLAKLVPGAVNVHGSMAPEQKAELLLAFAAGDIRHMITKPGIAAFGLNWQHCARMAFVGLSDSYEAYYQCIRRCYRYGQTRPVHVHLVLSELEGQIATNVARKERDAARFTGELVEQMRDAAHWESAAA